MAEGNRSSIQQREAYLLALQTIVQVSERAKRSIREYSDAETCDEALRLEEERLKSKIQRATEHAQHSIQNPSCLHRFGTAVNELVSYNADLEALQERKETHIRQVQALDDSHPIANDIIIQGMLRLMPQLLPSSSTSPPGREERALSYRDGRTRGADTDSSNTSVSLQTIALLARAPSHEPERREGGPDQSVENAPGPSDDGNSIIAAGAGTTIDRVASAATGVQVRASQQIQVPSMSHVILPC